MSKNRSQKEIERWERVFAKCPDTALDRLRRYLCSIVLGAEFGEDRNAYIRRIGLMDFRNWAMKKINANL